MPLYPPVHGFTHQEIIGNDSLVNYGLYKYLPRVTKTANNATPIMFAGISNNIDNTLQSGNGWTSSNNSAGNMNYTGDFLNGTQCIQLKTGGTGSATATQCTSPRMTAVDLTNKMVRIWLKIDSSSANNFGQCNFYVGSGASQFQNFGSVQFAFNGMNILNQYTKLGEWVPWTFNACSFIGITGTIDWTSLQDFRVAIHDNGNGPVTVYFGGIDFIANDTTYPHGVVSITFDDSYAAHYTKARPKMEQYGYKGTFYFIHDIIGQANYMTQTQIDALQAEGHEIAYHSWLTTNHNATGGYSGISQTALVQDIGDMCGWMHQETYKGLTHMAYPQGMFDIPTMNIIKQQFGAARLTYLPRIETLPVADPYRLCAWTVAFNSGLNITPNSTVGTVEWYLDMVYNYGGWWILFTHDIVDSGASGNQTFTSNFNTVVDYIATKGIPVRTVGDVLGL